MHPSSVLFSRRVGCVVFNELLFTTRLYIENSMPLHYPLRLVALTPKRIPRSKPARGRGVGGRAGSWVVARCCAMRVRLPSLRLRVQVVRGSVAHAVARGSVAHAVPGPGGAP